MQKDARIALGVILILMVIVVLIWGRTPRPENQARKGPEKSPAAKSDEPKGPAKPDASGAPAPDPPVNLPAQARVTATRPPSMFPEQATQPAKATFTYSNPPAADAGTPPDDGHTASQPPETDAGTPGPAEDTHTPGAERETDTGPAPAPAPLATHIVQKGDTYQSVSRKHYDTVKMWRIIYEANRIPADSLHVGHKLIIPAAPGHPAPPPQAPDQGGGPAPARPQGARQGLRPPGPPRPPTHPHRAEGRDVPEPVAPVLRHEHQVAADLQREQDSRRGPPHRP